MVISHNLDSPRTVADVLRHYDWELENALGRLPPEEEYLREELERQLLELRNTRAKINQMLHLAADRDAFHSEDEGLSSWISSGTSSSPSSTSSD